MWDDHYIIECLHEKPYLKTVASKVVPGRPVYTFESGALIYIIYSKICFARKSKGEKICLGKFYHEMLTDSEREAIGPDLRELLDLVSEIGYVNDKRKKYVW